MAEFFTVALENLTDTLTVDHLRPIDAALIEPLACVVKSLGMAPGASAQLGYNAAVIGLGAMGLMHMLLLPRAIGYDLNERRLNQAHSLGLGAQHPSNLLAADVIFVCPGNKPALDLALQLSNPGATIVLFAPMPPGAETPVDLNKAYFNDIRIAPTYSCGPDDTKEAAHLLEQGVIKAEQVVSDFIGIEDLPEAYQKMKRGDILKAMVVF